MSGCALCAAILPVLREHGHDEIGDGPRSEPARRLHPKNSFLLLIIKRQGRVKCGMANVSAPRRAGADSGNKNATG